ncbi:MAG: four helix bundle protein [Pseudomonadales bacterium]|nr:four helix bundle protein [Pseudomonadales bacterium]
MSRKHKLYRVYFTGAEGAGRNGSKAFIQFLYIALGSLVEVETQIEIAQRLGYVNETEPYNAKIHEIRRMLIGLINYLKQK